MSSGTYQPPEPARPGGLLRAAVIAFVPLLVSAGVTALVARFDGVGFSHAVLLPPEPQGAVRFSLALIALVSSYFGLFFAPGLLLVRSLGLRLPNAVAYALAAFVLSMLAVSLGWIAAQAFTEGIAGRVCLYLTVAAIDVAALVAGVALAPGEPALPTLPATSRGTGAAELLVPAVGVLLLCATVWVLMPGKIATEALEAGATEVHGFAMSLMYSALPEWDLDSGVWGFYPTFMFVAYPVFFSIAALGDSEAALRLPALLFLGMTLLATADLASRGRTRRAAGSLNVLLPILVVGYLSAQVGAYYAAYHPFHGDLGGMPLEEWLVTALGMAAFLLIRDGAPGLAAVSALLAVLAFPSGAPLMVFIGLVGLFTGTFEERRVLWRWAIALAALFLAYAAILVIYTVNTGTFGAMVEEWYTKYFAGRAAFGTESPHRMFLAAGWFTLLCGGLPLAGLVLAVVRGDRVARWLALSAALWVTLFLLSPNKHIHYFMPAAFLPMAAALRVATGLSRLPVARWSASALTLSAVLCVALCAPASVPPYTADREFGEETVFLARNERQAAEYANVLYNVADPLYKWRSGRPWTIDRHTWVMYSDLRYEFDREYTFYVGEGPAPVDGLQELSRMSLSGGRTVTLWARGGSAALQGWKQRQYAERVQLSPFNFDMFAGMQR